MKLKYAVPCLQEPSHAMCFKCRGEYLEEDMLEFVACCGRTFHRSCLLDVGSCPFCTVAWGGLICVKCGGHTVHRRERELYRSFEKRRNNRMVCCGVDVHPECKKWIYFCSSCGVSPREIDMTAKTFVYLRREGRRNEGKRRSMFK